MHLTSCHPHHYHLLIEATLSPTLPTAATKYPLSHYLACMQHYEQAIQMLPLPEYIRRQLAQTLHRFVRGRDVTNAVLPAVLAGTSSNSRCSYGQGTEQGAGPSDVCAATYASYHSPDRPAPTVRSGAATATLRAQCSRVDSPNAWQLRP